MRLEVWAPRARSVEAVTADFPAQELAPDDHRTGWFAGDVAWLTHGVDYLLRLDGGDAVPDPRARRLPAGVRGPSRAWDPCVYAWADEGWPGRSLAQPSVVYELHVGTFTSEGTLDAATAELDRLVDLGVTHVELMPLSAFDGDRGWGYDPVGIDAVHEPYGGPDALCRFVDAAHAQGLAVLLDLVQNHLGPTGSVWDRFGPLLSDAHRTPWGEAMNLDGPDSDGVRDVLLSSATGWLRDFHLDGLRLDAVHELHDERAVPYLEQLAEGVDTLAEKVRRPLSLVAESDQNDPRTVTGRAAGGLGMTAQWDDDVHHALHWLLTGETQGYYADFASVDAVAHTLERGFRHDGTWSSFRGRTHGRPVDWSVVDPWRFVVALQTHDQVGNRALGDRLAELVDGDLVACGAALLLTLPYTPMLFMGEEWGSRTPWQFFSSFPEPTTGSAVTEGRRAEFANHGWDADVIPDPQDPETFRRSVVGEPPDGGGTLLQWYRRLARLRATEPGLGPARAGAAPTAGGMRCSWDPGTVEGTRPRWFCVTRGEWSTAVNLCPDEVEVPLGSAPTAVAAAWRDAARTSDGAPCVVLAAHSAAVVRTARPVG